MGKLISILLSPNASRSQARLNDSIWSQAQLYHAQGCSIALGADVPG